MNTQIVELTVCVGVEGNSHTATSIQNSKYYSLILIDRKPGLLFKIPPADSRQFYLRLSLFLAFL